MEIPENHQIKISPHHQMSYIPEFSYSITKLPNYHITTSPNDPYAANVSFIARFRVASTHFISATLIIQNERTMKTTSHVRMFIVIAMMTASACSEPEIVPWLPEVKPKLRPPSNQISNREFHSTVITWTQPDGGNYVGPVQAAPEFDLSKARITAVGNGQTIKVDTFLDVTKVVKHWFEWRLLSGHLFKTIFYC